MERDLTYQEMQNIPDGSIVSTGCPVCEGLEKHKKINGVWVCQWCSGEEDKEV